MSNPDVTFWMSLVHDLDQAEDGCINTILDRLYTIDLADATHSATTKETAQAILHTALAALVKDATAAHIAPDADPYDAARALCDDVDDGLWASVMEDMRLQTGLHNFRPALLNPTTAAPEATRAATIYGLLAAHYAAQESIDEALYAAMSANLWARVDPANAEGVEELTQSIDTLRGECEGDLCYTLEPILRPLIKAAGAAAQRP